MRNLLGNSADLWMPLIVYMPQEEVFMMPEGSWKQDMGVTVSALTSTAR